MREKALVQARLDSASFSTREREHSQQLSAKEMQISALQTELSTMAGELVAQQAEVRARDSQWPGHAGFGSSQKRFRVAPPQSCDAQFIGRQAAPGWETTHSQRFARETRQGKWYWQPENSTKLNFWSSGNGPDDG